MIINNLIALDQYTCPKVEKQKLQQEWEKFISNHNTSTIIRPIMYDSWQRCLKQGISPLQSKTSINLSEEEIMEYVSTDPLFHTLKPVLTKLKNMYMDSGHLITFTNSSGDIVYLDGDLSLMLKAEDMNLVAGSSWAENNAGTNAIGTAIVTGSPIQVFAGEHFCQELQKWTCSATPIRDPATQKILGVINMAGLWVVNHPHVLSVVSSAARDVNEMLLRQLKGERFKLLEYYKSKNISLQSKSCLAVLDRGGRVMKASPLLYEQGLIDSNHFLIGTPSFSLSSTTRMHWEYGHLNGMWRFELTPYIYGGMPIGSIVHVIPPTLTSFNDISFASNSSFPSMIDGTLPSSLSINSFTRKGIHRTLNDKKQVVEKRSIKLPDFYKSLFEHNPDGIFSCDLQANLLDANPALERMIGYSVKELQEISLPSLILPEYLENGMKYFEKTMKGKPQEYVVAIKHKNGYPIDIKVKNFPIFIDNEIVGVYGIVKDITENKQMEEDLQSTKQQLNLFLKNTMDSIIIFDLKHNVIKVNKAFEEVFGWTEQEVIGSKKPIIPDFLVDQYTEILQKILNNRHVMSFETIRQRKDGSLIDVSSFVSPIVNAKGNVTAFVSILRDITEHKLMEEALKESEMKYRVLFEQTPDAVYLVELDGDRSPRFIEINPVGCERFGYSREELLSMPLTDVVPQDSRQYIRFMEKIRGGQRSFTLQDEYVFKSGKKMNVELSFQRFNLGGKEVFLATSRDITDRLKTEELLRKSEKLAVVGHLATAIAHEVNNPLTVMKGFIQLLKSTEHESHHRYIDVVLSEISRIEGITNEFMAAAKPQAVKVQPNDMYMIIEQVTLLFQPQVNINNVQIKTEFESGIPYVPFERNQLKQVFINILKNAIESMPQGGEVLIQVKKSDEHQVCVSIIDQGCGIPKERMPYIGEPFYSIKEEGVGLGLMICYKIMEAHGGQICIESEVGKGTKVDVILPIHTLKSQSIPSLP
ncbi:PAS domain S-box-containing protein [Bacillus pakistanensis]|uniref:histidine kinase n=1 Tax=Rossellomorea pakistanensis TaxID=992288 RepID=A0ABS2NHW0_9BACI|nr:PAS domain S-box protein [Bacillus pakistanensis]MBM7587451.1 PAS domain S-box-containing protein [Bacillus pakistanensis]